MAVCLSVLTMVTHVHEQMRYEKMTEHTHVTTMLILADSLIFSINIIQLQTLVNPNGKTHTSLKHFC